MKGRDQKDTDDKSKNSDTNHCSDDYDKDVWPEQFEKQNYKKEALDEDCELAWAPARFETERKYYHEIKPYESSLRKGDATHMKYGHKDTRTSQRSHLQDDTGFFDVEKNNQDHEGTLYDDMEHMFQKKNRHRYDSKKVHNQAARRHCPLTIRGSSIIRIRRSTEVLARRASTQKLNNSIPMVIRMCHKVAKLAKSMPCDINLMHKIMLVVHRKRLRIRKHFGEREAVRQDLALGAANELKLRLHEEQLNCMNAV